MGFQFQSSDKLRNGRIDHKSIKKVDVIANENACAVPIEPRGVSCLKTDASEPQNVTEEQTLRPVVPSRIDDDPEQDKEGANSEKVNQTDCPEANTPQDQATSSQHVKSLEHFRIAAEAQNAYPERLIFL
jgi:hypothetical protein